MQAMNKYRVVILNRELLAYSKTFVLEQMKYLKSWEPILVGVKEINGLNLDCYHHEVVRLQEDSFLGKFMFKIIDKFWLKYCYFFSS